MCEVNSLPEVHYIATTKSSLEEIRKLEDI